MSDQEKEIFLAENAKKRQEAMDNIRKNIEELKKLEPNAKIYLQNEHGSYSLMGKILFMFQPNG